MRQMLATDLDGTLLDAHSRLSTANREALVRLGAAGVLRVVATGRSLYSARKVIAQDWPIDYLVFSSGAGIVDWRKGRLVRAVHLSREEAACGVELMLQMELDFMLHGPVPDNHRFWYRRVSSNNADFDRRVDRYTESAVAWPGMSAILATLERAAGAGGARFCQLLAVVAPDGESHLAEIARALPELSVIRSTSPLDHRSLWIEIFPPTVSKSQAVAWLCAEHGIQRSGVAALGNDYNDEDLLEWAASGWVVGNAAAPLLRKFSALPSNDADGFARAAEQVLAMG